MGRKSGAIGNNGSDLVTHNTHAATDLLRMLMSSGRESHSIDQSSDGQTGMIGSRNLIEQLAGAHMQAQVVRAFGQLRLADAMASGPADVTSLGHRSGCAPDRLGRLMRAACALGLCVEDDAGRFGLTALGMQLRSDGDATMLARALLLTEPWFTAPWNHLAEVVQRGPTPFESAHAVDLWGYLDHNPAAAQLYAAAMADNAAERAEALHEHVTLKPESTIVDVGGGFGRLLVRLLARLPASRGVLVERPPVVDRAVEHLAAAGLTDRVSVIPADARAFVPVGSDVYLLSRVLHNWPDEAATEILGACRRAMTSTARLFILERMGTQPSAADALETALTDLNMLVLYGGQERTADQYATLAHTAGFSRVRRVRDDADLGILEVAI